MQPGWLLVVGLAGCGRIDFVPCSDAVEQCNGIDDNCNGVVDEGCTCTPFMQTMPGIMPQQFGVSTGTGFLLKGTTAITVIDDGGTITTGATGPPWLDSFSAAKQKLAWNGTEVVEVAADGRLVWFGIDGTGVHEGPDLGLQPNQQAVLSRAEDGGYDILAAPCDIGAAQYIHTDASGAPIATAEELSPTYKCAIAAYSNRWLRGAAWLEERDVSVATTSSGTLSQVIVPDYDSEDETDADVDDSDGVLVVVSGFYYLVRGTNVMLLDSIPAYPTQALWNGTGWAVAAYRITPNLVVLEEEHIDPTGATTPEILATFPYTTNGLVGPPSIFGDGHRTLYRATVTIDGAVSTTLIQRCP